MIPKSEIYRKQKAQAEAELAQCNHQIERLQNRMCSRLQLTFAARASCDRFDFKR